MFKIKWPRVSAERYHRFLPEDIRTWLKGRGIPATLIETHLLGWNGTRITIPIFSRDREVLGFRYAKSPNDQTDSPAMLSDQGSRVALYGAETLARNPRRVVICEGEFDRLVLEANGFPAVTSTAGPETFLEAWLPYFEPVKHVYICFSRRLASERAARDLQQLLPHARIVKLPPEVGPEGDVSDFFVELGRTKLDFEVLLAGATLAPDTPHDPGDTPPAVRLLQPRDKTLQNRAKHVRKSVRLHKIAARYTDLEAEGSRLVGHCPFCNGSEPSFRVCPANDTYSCLRCRAEGDVVQFLMEKESMDYEEALDALETFQLTNEPFCSG